MAATIRDVARASGVHASTVSRAFTTPHLVNSQTRSKVLDIAQQLGYQPHRVVYPRHFNRTHSLALVVRDLNNPAYLPLIRASQRAAWQHDYHVLVADSNADAQTEQDLVCLLAGWVDGIVLCNPWLSNALIDNVRRQVPVVLVNRVADTAPRVVMDIGSGVSAAVQHLVGLGHRHLVLLSGPRGCWLSREIRRAMERAVRERGLRLDVFGPNPPTGPAGYRAAASVGESGATAVLAYNDLMAVGLIEGLAALDIPVPSRISVIGIDDIPLGRRTRPALTTIAMPTEVAGRTAVGLLLDNQAGTTQTLSTTLVVRESTGLRPAPPATA
jgi:LacI family transcriptional regulator